MSKNIINDFYTAFQQMDAEGMAACYHPDITFQDPAFGKLNGAEVGNMWRMLIKSQQGKEFKVSFNNIQVHDEVGSADWEAWYTFTPTGRKIHNKIKASFVIQNGKIIAHQDQFDLYRWARQALGLKGLLLGWSSFFQKKLQNQTQNMLKKFTKNRPSNTA